MQNVEEEQLERLTPELVLVSPDLAEQARQDLDVPWIEGDDADEPPAKTALADAPARARPAQASVAPRLEAAEPAPAVDGQPERGAPAAVVEGLDEHREERRATRGRLRLVGFTALFLVWIAALVLAEEYDRRNRADRLRPAPPEPAILVVPDVRDQPFVFAKGMLEDAGFAWRVVGGVQGYSANLVAAQRPPKGAAVFDTGAPTVILRLKRNREYPQHGKPQNSSPYPGTKLVLAKGGKSSPRQDDDVLESPKRPPDFYGAGTPPDPADDVSLARRAFLLASWLANRPKPTRAVVRKWRFEHARILSRARSGSKGAATALRVLIQVDRDMQARWGIGADRAAAARAALRDIQRKPNAKKKPRAGGASRSG